MSNPFLCSKRAIVAESTESSPTSSLNHLSRASVWNRAWDYYQFIELGDVFLNMFLTTSTAVSSIEYSFWRGFKVLRRVSAFELRSRITWAIRYYFVKPWMIVHLMTPCRSLRFIHWCSYTLHNRIDLEPLSLLVKIMFFASQMLKSKYYLEYWETNPILLDELRLGEVRDWLETVGIEQEEATVRSLHSRMALFQSVNNQVLLSKNTRTKTDFHIWPSGVGANYGQLKKKKKYWIVTCCCGRMAVFWAYSSTTRKILIAL